MLARVDKDMVDSFTIRCRIVGVDGVDEWGDFHEVGAGADNGNNFHRKVIKC
jgi:hypothetical protein